MSELDRCAWGRDRLNPASLDAEVLAAAMVGVLRELAEIDGQAAEPDWQARSIRAAAHRVRRQSNCRS